MRSRLLVVALTISIPLAACVSATARIQDHERTVLVTRFAPGVGEPGAPQPAPRVSDRWSRAESTATNWVGVVAAAIALGAIGLALYEPD